MMWDGVFRTAAPISDERQASARRVASLNVRD
jgi:hypothetical protein